MVTRRSFLTAAAAAGLASGQRRRPNFVVMLADDLGYSDLGCTGFDVPKATLNIDQLARTGTRFTNWYSNAPVCAPSRAALMTGRYPMRAGVATNGLALPASEKTIATLLKSSGYKTGITGKWHLGSDDLHSPNAHGFDTFFGFHSGCVDYYSHRYYWGEPRGVNYHDLYRNRTETFEDGQYLTDGIAREAVDFIGRNHRDPFFLYVPFNAPHYPMHAPAEYMRRFPDLPLEKQVRAAMLSSMDDAVGAITQALQKHRLTENTLIFFSSDNGATREPRAGLDQKPPVTGFNGPYRGFKFSLFDGGMHVPAIMNWPGVIPAGQVNAGVAAHMDVLPTVCGAAGVSPPVDRVMDGRDVLPMAQQKAPTPHETIFWSNGPQTAARSGHWKLVRSGFLADGSAETRRPMQGDDAIWLSNLERDPGESRNVAKQHPEIAARLSGAIDAWLASVKSDRTPR